MKLIRTTPITDAILTACNVTENDADDAPLWSATNAYVTAGTQVRRAETHRIYEAAKVASVATVAISIASPGVITWDGHGFVDGAPVKFSTTGALPTGLTAGTQYYVKSPTAAGFSVAAAAGGAAINTSGTQSGVHTATVSSNYGKTPEDNTDGTTPYWFEVGATNKWAMFDESLSLQTEKADQITATLAPGRINTVSFFGLDANEVTVSMTSASEGGATVYSRVESLALSNVFDWYDYFTEPIIRKDKIVFDDLPVYGDGVVSVVIDNTGDIAKCGELSVGLSRYIGKLQWKPRVRIINYSKKKTNDYGITKLNKRGYSDLIQCELVVDNELVDEVKRVLSDYRSTVAVWVGDGDFTSMTVLGFYNDFEILLADPAGSLCSLEIEGI